VAFALSAQEFRGTIVGRITDQSGAVMAGVNVEITNKLQGVKLNLTSNESGQYQAPFLTPGQYQVSASRSGFKRSFRDSIEVNVSDRVSVDLVLEVGGTDQSVTVTSEQALLETTNGSVGKVIDGKRLTELPIAHGQPFSLIGLTAGTAFTGSQTLDRPFEPTHIVGYAVNGVRANRSDVTIDGIASTSTANANEVTASYVPPADIVQEFRVQTAAFDAQFGNTEGGNTNVVLKSGTNRFAGSAYYYKMPAELFANNWFANANRQARPDFEYNRWGGYFSGPIRIPKVYDGRNKTFFLWGYEQFDESRPRNNGVQTTLTDPNKRGDFSALLALSNQYQIYNPLTRRALAGGVFQADPFPGNIVPPSMISPVATGLLRFWPSPISPGLPDGRNNLAEPNLQEGIKYWNHTGKLDHNFTERDRMAFRISSYDRESDYNNYFKTLATGEQFQFISRTASADYVKILSPTAVLNLRYGYNRFIRATKGNPESQGFDLASVGFSPAYASQIPVELRRFPGIDIAGYQGTNGGGEDRPTDTHNGIVTVNQSLGAHAVKYGGEWRNYRENAIFTGNDGVGRFAFDTSYTRGPLNTAAGAPNNLGQSAAAFLLGLPTSASVTRLASYSEQSHTFGFFVHDDWRVNSRLTLNIGLRYEVEKALAERYDRSVRGFDPTVAYTLGTTPVRGAITIAGVNGAPSYLYSTPKGNFMPRFGFAYKLDNKTVLRGGYGIYYGFLGQRRGDAVLSGFSRTTTFNSTSNGLTFPVTLSNAFTSPILEPRPAAEIASTLVGTGLSFFNDQPLTSNQQRWQMNVQRQIGSNWVVEAGYVGNRGTRIEITRNLNALPNQFLSTTPTRDNPNNNFLAGQVTNPFAGALPGTTLNNATIARSQTLLAFPQFGALNTTTNQGYTWYHSLQSSLSKRFNKGYTIDFSYTWSRFMQATEYLNPADAMPTEIVSDVDIPHRATTSAIWELPMGKGKLLFRDSGPIVSRIVGGWQLQGIFSFQSGRPMGNFGNVIFNGNYSNLPSADKNVRRYFNIDAGFNRVAAEQLVSNIRTFPFRFSNLRVDSIRNVDMSMIKNTTITERVNLQLRFEALNVLNTVNFAQPDINPTSASFGQITAANNYARRIQMGLRMVF
jgi:hypothetical protein